MPVNMPMPIERIKLLITLTDRGKGAKIVEKYKANNVHFNLICLAHGTANSDILDYLGLGESDKDLIITVIKESKVFQILEFLKTDIKLKEPGHGVAFTIPIDSVGGPKTLAYMTMALRKEQK
ncbi:MAG: hypothetical protein PHQ49_06325 [Clostridia bacterium]|nr:hypothetical protein [Clostridia bacterium]